MRRNILWGFSVLTVFLLAALLGGCNGDGGTAAPTAAKVQKGDTLNNQMAAAGFVGSEKCQTCHPEQFVGWSNTLHNKPLKTFAELGDGILVNDGINIGAGSSATAGNGQNDFKDGLNFNNYSSNGKVNAAGTAAGVTTDLGYNNPFQGTGTSARRQPFAPILSHDATTGKYFIQIGQTTYEVLRTQGGNGYWKQRYHTKIGNAYYVLNVQYNEVTKRYAEYNGNNWYSAASTTHFSDAYGSPALIQSVANKMKTVASGGPAASSWDNRCAGCHQTGMTAEYKDFGNGVPEVVTGYVELNVGCEACHGPGATHVASAKAADIINPQKLLASGKDGLYLANEVCGKCHTRTEGFAHFSSSFGRVAQPVEAPSKHATSDRTKAIFASVGTSLVSFIELDNVGVWGTKTATTYGPADAPLTNFQSYAASRQHHQQWNDMEQGAHGSTKQHGSGLTCWSCHNVHSTAKPHMIKSSINGQATDAHDNTLCLACHNTGFTGATDFDKVKNHLAATLGEAKAAKLTPANYLKALKQDGTASKYGAISILNGECVSCHMPLTMSSAITNDDNMKYKQGDIHSHTMQVLMTTPGLQPATTNKGPSSCSGCHAIP